MSPQDGMITQERVAEQEREKATQLIREAAELSGFARTAALDQARQHDARAERFEGYAKQARANAAARAQP